MTTTTPETVVIVPVLRRVHRIRPLVASLEAATPEPHRTIFVATSTDRPMIAEVQAVAAEYADRARISLEVLEPNRVGDYARKVNHAYRSSAEPFLFTGADDLDFQPGWLSAALAPMLADDRIGVVGTQDRCNRRTIAGTHSTHFLFRRRYVDELGTIDQPGRVFHEGYPHEFVDDEAVETAKFRGAWYFAADSVVEHLHPMNGRAPVDDLYAAQGQRMRAGRRELHARRPLWTAPPARPTPSTVSIIVATFGDPSWRAVAEQRAVPSARAAGAAAVIVEHGETLAAARNDGAARAGTEWLCFLDADDELEPGYLDAMAATETGELLAPAIRYVVDGAQDLAEPVTFADRDMRTMNPCPIGTLIRRETFVDVGGFWGEPAWEDWSLFRRAWLLGATIAFVPAAVYRAHVNPAGRNQQVPNPAGLRRHITSRHAQWLRQRKAQG